MRLGLGQNGRSGGAEGAPGRMVAQIMSVDREVSEGDGIGGLETTGGRRGLGMAVTGIGGISAYDVVRKVKDSRPQTIYKRRGRNFRNL